jgi:hypothetical protein
MSQQPPHTTERRGFARKRAKGARCRCRKGMMGLGPDLALALLDLSQTGALLLLKVPLELKQPVAVELFSTAYPKPVSVDARVARCTPTPEGTYLVGVRFERNLSYADVHRLT